MELPGGGVFVVFSLLVVAIMTVVLLFHYSQREVSWYSYATAFGGFLLSIGFVMLVPFDVWEALALEDPQLGHTTKVLIASNWEFVYWTAFLLSWLVAPLLIEYEAAGGFSIHGRIRAMVHRNFHRNVAWSVSYVIFGALIVIGIMTGGWNGLRAWCIACSNAWGMLLATVLMGYGLVAVPRHLWRLANPAEQLSVMYCVAVSMDEARLSTQFELQDVINEARTEIASRSVQMWDPMLERAFGILQTTLEECEQLHCELTNGARGPREGGQACGGVPRGGEIEDATRLESLGELHRALKQASMEARRAACRWDGLVRSCMLLEDLEEQLYPSAVEIASSWQGTCARMLFRCSAARSCWHGTVLLWLRTLRPRVLRIASVLSGMLSVAMVLGQLTMFSRSWSLSVLALFFTTRHGFWMTQAFCFVPLSYMVCVAYWSLFRLKIAGLYGLYDNHNTDTGSLLWCASVLTRLTAPLCYHFLFLIRVEKTAFQEVLDQMQEVPILGGSFNQIFPVLVAFLCVCNLLNVYSRLVQFFGLDSLEVEWAPSGTTDSSDLLTEGRRLVDRVTA